ncbi:hypothetical protein [Dysgonomonas sp. BGC7]|uniref:hypothetical protein n=1 Tax=Dysgonomonas sp. BGC7 TaxID=1658008 RepID=UPI0006806760|nr:hypothetical protein [Dysgonomonas sp. BGC7]MBD8390275.1 hypothetical protein [Dysgonomonas sp. BGC7]
MIKQRIKIIILFILLLSIIVAGGYMYKRLEYNRQSFASDIYSCIPAQTKTVININKLRNINQIISDSTLVKLANISHDMVSYPILICKNDKGESLLLAKINPEQETTIKAHIKTQTNSEFSVKERKSKNAEILFYPLSGDNFLVCTFYHGLMAISKSYKYIEDFTHSPTDSMPLEELIRNKQIIQTFQNYDISCFTKNNRNMLALAYNITNDTIFAEGYAMLPDNSNDTLLIRSNIMQHIQSLPDSFCIDNYQISTKENPATVRFSLNKIH